MVKCLNSLIKITSLQIEDTTGAILLWYTNCSQITLWNNESFSVNANDSNSFLIELSLNGTILRTKSIINFTATSLQSNNPTHYGIGWSITWINRVTFEFEETIAFYPSIGTSVHISKIIWQYPVAYVTGWGNVSAMDVGGVYAYIAATATYDLSAGTEGTRVFSIGFSYQSRNVTSVHYRIGNITWAAAGAGYLIISSPGFDF